MENPVYCLFWTRKTSTAFMQPPKTRQATDFRKKSLMARKMRLTHIGTFVHYTKVPHVGAGPSPSKGRPEPVHRKPTEDQRAQAIGHWQFEPTRMRLAPYTEPWCEDAARIVPGRSPDGSHSLTCASGHSADSVFRKPLVFSALSPASVTSIFRSA
jgi:hypothetical protein